MSNSQINQIYLVLSLIGLAVLVAIPLIYIDQLPDRIPIHYDSSGTPNRYSGKSGLWTLPILGTVVFVVMAIVGYFLPNQRHDPKKHSKEVHDLQIGWSIHLCGILNVTCAWSFAYIVYRTVQVALGNVDGLGSGFTPIFLGLILIPIVYVWWKMYRESE